MFKFSSSINVELVTFVIFWGFLVRITDSGDGCGASWPLCPELKTLSAASLIEFVHRLSTIGLVFFFTIFAIKAWRFFYLRKLIHYILVLISLEALIGAIIVLGKFPGSELNFLKLTFYGGHIIISSLLLIFFCLLKEATHSAKDVQLVAIFKNTPLILLLLLAFSGSINASLSVSKEFQNVLQNNHLMGLSYFQKFKHFLVLHFERLYDFLNISPHNLGFFDSLVILFAHSHLALSCILLLVTGYNFYTGKFSAQVSLGIGITALTGAIIPLSFGHKIAKAGHVFFYLISLRLLTVQSLRSSEAH